MSWATRVVVQTAGRETLGVARVVIFVVFFFIIVVFFL